MDMNIGLNEDDSSSIILKDTPKLDSNKYVFCVQIYFSNWLIDIVTTIKVYYCTIIEILIVLFGF